MIAEHEFITTFDQEEALAAAANTLNRMGFKTTLSERRVVGTRGVEKPAKAVREKHLPQSVELRFDRGRCTLAASITPAGKPKSLHRDLITSALTTLENVLAHGQSDEQALQGWKHIDQRAASRTTQHSGCRRITLWVLVGFLCLLLLGCIIGMLTSSYP